MLAHQRRQFKAIRLRHVDVDEYDRDVRLEEMVERLPGRPRLDQGLAEITEHRLVAEQLGRLIVDEEDVDAFLRTQGHLTGVATREGQTAVVRCSPASPDSRT